MVNLKSGLESLKPYSLVMAAGGAFMLYIYGYGLSPLTWQTELGYGLLGTGVVSYFVDNTVIAFL